MNVYFPLCGRLGDIKDLNKKYLDPDGQLI